MLPDDHDGMKAAEVPRLWAAFVLLSGREMQILIADEIPRVLKFERGKVRK